MSPTHSRPNHPTRAARLVEVGVLLASVTVASAQEATLTIPPQPDGGTAYQRVKRLLPPHVGCAVLVTGRDERGKPVVFKRGFGYRRLRAEPGEDASATRVTTQTNFRVASLTKVFTAAAVPNLADDGRLSLDDPIRKWLPGMPAYCRDVTVRHLLTHTSGVTSYSRLMNNRAPAFFNDLALLRTIAGAPRLDFAAGTECVYSNTGYVLLGLIVKQASRMPFEAYLREAILRPIGMRQSDLLVEGLTTIPHRAYGNKTGPAKSKARLPREARLKQMARLRDLRERVAAQGANLQAIDRRLAILQAQFDEEARHATRPPLGDDGFDPSQWHEEDQGPFSELLGDGALYTSIDDLQVFLDAVRDRRVPLSESSYDLWLETQSTPQPGSFDGAADRRYTCGWVLDDRLGEPRYSHRGATRGFRQTLQWLPKSGRAVVVLMNSVPGGAEGPGSWDDARIERLGEQLLQTVLDPTDERTGLERLAQPMRLGE